MSPVTNIIPIRPERAVDGEPVVVELGLALHAAGAPAGRVEAAMTTVAQRWGLRGTFLVTPTSVQAAFGPVGAQRVSLVRVSPAGVALGRLADLEALLPESRGPRALRRALRHLPERRWSIGAGLAAAAALGGAATLGLGGDLRSAALGVGVGLAVRLLEERAAGAAARVVPLVGAALAALLAVVGARVLGLPTAWPALLGGLIQLAPGYTFTVAVTEVAAAELVSGAARLGAAVTTFLQLAIGLAATAAALDAWPLLAPAPAATPTAAWSAALVEGLAYVVLLQASVRHTPLIVIGALSGQAASVLATAVLGPWWAPVGAAALLSAGSELGGRALGRPAALLLVPALLALVPGGAGIGGLFRLLHDDGAGLSAALGAGVVAVSLASGVLLGSLIAGRAPAPRSRRRV